MFGLSFGEVLVLLVVGVVVIGPKNLPTMMRTAGQWIARLRRMSVDLRNQSGIDDLIRREGLEREIEQLRSLSRGNVVESLVAPVLASETRRTLPQSPQLTILREREYPTVGCDSYGAKPDDVNDYIQDESSHERVS